MLWLTRVLLKTMVPITPSTGQVSGGAIAIKQTLKTITLVSVKQSQMIALDLTIPYDPSTMNSQMQCLNFPPLPAILVAVAYLWYSNYMDKKGVDHIGHNAHYTGAIFGIVFIVVATLVFKPAFFDLFIQQLLAGPEPHPWFSNL